MTQPSSSPVPSAWVLRVATDSDAEAIAGIWHRGWLDGHLGHVPPSLHQYRQIDDFRERTRTRIDLTTVAVTQSRLLGFVTVNNDEIEQIYVDEGARGGGVAAALLAHGEGAISVRYPIGWLAVVAGNARARRFYERHGWSDAGPIDYLAETMGGAIVVPSRRYEKGLTHE